MDNGLIIRVDDVSPNTDMRDLNACAEYLSRELGAKVWYCVNLFAGFSHDGAVYPDVPLRGKPLRYFLNVNSMFRGLDFPSGVRIVSHGLIHAEHAKMTREAQELSIMVSCGALGTEIFVPPFISHNADTRAICAENNIEIVDGIGWRSMETEPYDPSCRSWYFHHWRMGLEQIKRWHNAR